MEAIHYGAFIISTTFFQWQTSKYGNLRSFIRVDVMDLLV
jgi:hypothetical protein